MSGESVRPSGRPMTLAEIVEAKGFRDGHRETILSTGADAARAVQLAEAIATQIQECAAIADTIAARLFPDFQARSSLMARPDVPQQPLIGLFGHLAQHQDVSVSVLEGMSVVLSQIARRLEL